MISISMIKTTTRNNLKIDKFLINEKKNKDIRAINNNNKIIINKMISPETN